MKQLRHILAAVFFGASAATLLAQPANDPFATPTVLSGTSVTIGGTTVNATKEAGEPSHALTTGGKSVWYEWTAPFSANVTMTSDGSTFRSLLAAYTGTVITSLTPVASAIEPQFFGVASITFAATGGTIYKIAVDTRNNVSGGTFTLTLNQVVTPVVTLTAPTGGQTFTNPVSITLSANATSPVGTITNVSFYYGGSTLIGTDTNSPYSIVWSNITEGIYTVTARGTDTAGQTTTSGGATITVRPFGYFATQLVGSNAFSGTNTYWKYLDNGSDQGTAWIAPGFDDSAWVSGPAEIGYGEVATRMATTNLSFGPDPLNKYITTYFRTAFLLTNAPAMTNLLARFERDDGVIMYLNGVEVVRNNLPAGAPSYLTLASANAADDGTTFFPTNINPALLINGLNVLAAEIHQDTNTSSDITWYLELTGSGAGTPNALPVVSITSPAHGATFATGANISLTASATDADGTVTNVAYYQGVTKLGDVTAGPTFPFSWTNVAPGSYTLTAVATDNTGASTTSAGVGITVNTFVVVPTTLVATGAIWKYLDNGSDQGTAWQTNGFNDTTWSNGPAQLGYSTTSPENDEATFLSYGPDINNKYTNYYFRHAFTVTNAAAVSNLIIRMIRDDGAVVYINGTEVRRDNMPAGTITSTTPALLAVGGIDESTFFASTNSAAALVNGVNVIAVEVHQNSGTSSDVSFDLELIANTAQVVPPTNTAAPFVQSQNPLAGATVASLTSVAVTFSEPVSGVNAADFLVNGVPAMGLASNANTFTFSFPQPALGAVSISWTTNHGIVDQDPASLPFNATNAGSTWTYNLADLTAPVIVANVPVAGSTVSNLTSVQVTWSKNVLNVDASDMLINGLPAVGLSGSGSNYTFSFAQPAGGTANISWAGLHGITDPAGNPFNGNGAGATWSYTISVPPTVLIPSNSVWRFVKGTAEVSSPTSLWRTNVFDDSSWSNAPAPFYYGDAGYTNVSNPGTFLADMTNGGYLTVFLRKSFVLNNPQTVSNFIYRAQSDDGFVIWLNGVEVLRYNVAVTDPLFNTVASATAPEPGGNGGAGYINYTNTAGLAALVAGTNTFAIQGFNQSAASSDFGINIQIEAVIFDTGAPRIASVNPAAGQVTALTNLTVTFNQAVGGVDASDLLVNGVAATNVTGGSSNLIYTFAFPQPAFGAVSVTWATNHGITNFDAVAKSFDAVAPGATFNYTLVNPSAPNVAGQVPVAAASVGSLTSIQVTFSEPVTNVDAADLRINGAAATGLSGGPTVYNFTFPQPAYGPVVVTWATNHGIRDIELPPNDFDSARVGNSWSYTLSDLVAPTVLAKNPAAGAAVTNLTSLTVTFSEPVLGVNASDLLLNDVPATGLTTNNGTNFVFTFAQPNATIINMTWAGGHGITDTAATPNAFNAAGAGATWNYVTPDNLPPTVASIDPPPFITVRSLAQIRVTFTEPVVGVDAGDLQLNNQPATQVAGSGAGPYTFTYAAPTNGAAEVHWIPAHGITDLAAPANAFAGGEWSYTIDPNVNFAGEVVINEIMFDSLNGFTTEEWIELHNTTAALINLTGWQIDKGVHFTLPNVSIPAGGFLVVAANVATFQSNYPTVTNVIGGWVGTLNNNDESIELITPLGETASKVHYATEGDWARRERGGGASRITSLTRSGATATVTSFDHGLNAADVVIITGATQPEYNGRYTIASVPNTSTFTYTIAGTPVTPATGNPVAHLVTDNSASGWAWYSAASGNGSSLELINPKFDDTSGENWTTSTNLGGTPGRANTVLSSNVAPLIQEVTHFPLVPQSTDAVSISARVTDELSNGVSSVTLFYRNHTTTAPGGFLSATMFDDGAHSDGNSGDGIYAAVLPAAANGQIFEFYVQATDTTGHTRTWPAPVLETNAVGAVYGTLVQGANCLYQVDNEISTNNMPTVRAIMTGTERNVFPPSDRNSDVAYNLTFIYTSTGGSDVRYLCDARVRGAGTRSRTPTNNRLNIPNDNRWNGRAAFNLNSQFVHAQLMGNVVAEKAGLVAEQPFVVQYRINAVNPAPLTAPVNGTASGAGWGVHLLMRPVDGDLIANSYPDDASGDVYRASSGSHTANLNYLGTDPNSYINVGVYKTSNKTANDWTDMYNLTTAFSYTGANSIYVDLIQSNVNVLVWMRYFALSTLISDGETKLGNGIGDDYGLYRGVKDPRFVIQAHDFDTVFGIIDGGQIYATLTNSSIYTMLNPPNGSANVPLLRRFMTNNAFAPMFYSELKRIADNILNPVEFGSLVDQHLTGWGLGPDAATIAGIKSYAETRREIVLSQIPLTLTVSNSTLTSASGYLLSTVPSVSLYGTANAIDNRRVVVNGVDAGWSGWEARWTNTVALQSGINNVLIQSLNSNNVAIASTNLSIWYSNGAGTSVAGAQSGSPVWTPAGSPYTVTANLTVPAGVTLTIQPGTTVYVASGVTITVSGTGKILSEGTASQHIHIGRNPAVAGNWGSLDFINTTVESRLAYIDFDSCGGTTIGGHNAQLHVNGGSIIYIDHCTWPPTPVIEYISFDASSFVVQNCYFPSYPPPTGPESLHGINGIPAGGYGIFRGNYFGHTWGFNDTIDFTGGNRPGAILQFIGNVFDGASDDCLDLDSTDAWIEGNIFMHVHRDPTRTDQAIDTGSAISGGVDVLGQNSDWTIINNLF